MSAEIEEAARSYLAAGLSVIPIRVDGSKSPTLEWRPFMQSPIDLVRIASVFGGDTGIAIVGGAVSGGLEVMDFDDPAVFAPWSRVVEELSPGLLDTLPKVETPRGGRHVYYRCAEPASTKLARSSDRAVRIETKGEGGYVIAPPSPPACHPLKIVYRELAPPRIVDVPTLDDRQRDTLRQAARSFDLAAIVEREPRVTPGRAASDLRPGDDFNARGWSWEQILSPQGWTLVHESGGGATWRRPGKDHGISATTDRCGPHLYVFSTNAHPFEDGRAYTRWGAYTMLWHGGDFAASARALAAEGFGEQRVARVAGGIGSPATVRTSPDYGETEDEAANEDEQGTELLPNWSAAEAVAAWEGEDAPAALPAGIDALDDAIGGGLPVGQVTLLVGYTGVGKSELARQIRRSVAKTAHVLHVDVELGRRRVIERELSQEADIPSALLRRPNDLTDAQKGNLEDAKARVRTGNWRIVCPGSGVPLDVLGSTIERLAEPGGLVILDSLQRLAAGAPGDQQRLQIQNLMWWAGHLAQRLNVAVLMTSEQKRGADGGRPSVKDALTSGAESRAIEFQSDVMIVMAPDEEDEDDERIAVAATEESERRIRLLICKTREGNTGWVSRSIVFRGPCWGMDIEKTRDKREEKILGFLVGALEPASSNQIARLIGGKKASVLKKLNEMARAGHIAHTDDPKVGWVLGTLPKWFPGVGTGGN